ncbi:LysR family transcriptional regulator [Streptococcus panodentis]|uniref:LysR family transcriptional regulator n=1 Tax=Streptococcus panodentis TaxID=1581472 RepID=A0ABS5B0N7_9STRE|nr:MULTISPECIES: LysR family transcriptional regulator [Streptococcus]KXT83463.1 Nitrogen assimilation transcriptional activator NtcB [Streptococcus sp. DD11]MBP2622236.1 LysR family transcriptional regulator [Streptococcus panodentis]
MDAVKCQAFLKAAEQGSFTAAADSLSYSQSGITRMISSLEEELGFPLFIRQKKGVTLTEDGRLMLPLLRELVQAHQHAEELGAAIRGLVRGSLTLGCYFSVSSMWMPEILQQFAQDFPQVKVTMLEGGNKEIAKWLTEKSVDLCFCAKPGRGVDCDWIELYQDPLVAWLPSQHPKAAAASFAIKDLERESFIHTLPGQDTDQDRLIEQEGLKLQTRFSTKDGFTTYNMVEAGLGVSFNQRMIARKWSGRVAQVPLAPQRFVSLGLALPRSADPSPAAKRFIACVEEMVEELAGGTAL